MLTFHHPPPMTPNQQISTAHIRDHIYAIHPVADGWQAWVSSLHDSSNRKTRGLGTFASFPLARSACERDAAGHP